MDAASEIKIIQEKYRAAAGFAYSKGEDEEAAKMRAVADELEKTIELLRATPLPVYTR